MSNQTAKGIAEEIVEELRMPKSVRLSSKRETIMVAEMMEAHTKQRLTALKEKADGLKYDGDMQDWDFDPETYNKAISDVLTLIEEELQ